MTKSSNVSVLVEKLKADGFEVSHDVFASNLTTYRLGGSLKSVVMLKNYEEVERLASHLCDLRLESNEIFILGNGSNVIVNDSGFSGIVFKFSGDLADVISFKDSEVEVGAGMLLPKFARKCVSEGFSGTEFYVGIPGSIGGAIAMNAGGHGKQTSDVLKVAKVLSLTTGEIKDYKTDECDFSYRHSAFAATDLIVSGTFAVVHNQADATQSKSELDSIVKWRRENQPGGRNIGSVFQNAESASAGSLIEQCNLKGFRIGGAFVSDKHANFIQAEDGAKASDVIELIEHVRKVVKQQTGIELKNEVRYIGFDNE